MSKGRGMRTKPEFSAARSALVPGLMLAIAVQALAASFFLYDILSDIQIETIGFHFDLHAVMELLATLTLIVAIGVEVGVIRHLLEERERMQETLDIARGKFAEMIEENFSRWRLSPAEREVAWLAIKGFSIDEIARIRGAKGGTVKAQLGAVYRKAGVSRRVELLAILVEDLLDGGITGNPDPSTDESGSAKAAE